MDRNGTQATEDVDLTDQIHMSADPPIATSTADVYRGTLIQSGAQVAIKRLRFSDTIDQQVVARRVSTFQAGFPMALIA